MDKPTLYLTNWSSRKHHGPGRKFTIMARPRAWEHGEGRVPVLLPSVADLLDVKAGRITEALYFHRFSAQVEACEASGVLAPGRLGALLTSPTEHADPVADGDTLLCSCACGAPCHRRAAVPFLIRAGWRVILDGMEVLDG